MKGSVIVSAVATLSFGAVIILWLMKPPAEDSQILALLLGALASGFTQVLNYWLGSSAGSKSKDETISRIATGDGPPPPPVV